MLRQGDILLVRDPRTLRESAVAIDSGVIAVGEATGHAHRVVGGNLLLDSWSGMKVVSDGSAELVHDEHDTIQIPEGTYRVVRQREEGKSEYNYVAD